MSKDTKIRLALAVLVFMMVQAVLFGVGMIVLLLEPQEIKSLRYFRADRMVDRPPFTRPLLA